MLLPVGVEIAVVLQFAVAEAGEARDAFISRPVVSEVPLLQILATLPADADQCEGDCRASPTSPAEPQGIALHPADFIDQAGSGRPASRVKRSLMHQEQDALEGIHATVEEPAVPWARVGPPPPRDSPMRLSSSGLPMIPP